MRVFTILCVAVLLAGCASVGADSTEYQSLSQVTAVDLDAADAIAMAHGDQIGHLCYPALKVYLGTATPSTDQVKGVISAFEKARVTRKSLEGGIPTALKIACAPLLQDERDFLLRLGIMAGVGLK